MQRVEILLQFLLPEAVVIIIFNVSLLDQVLQIDSVQTALDFFTSKVTQFRRKSCYLCCQSVAIIQVKDRLGCKSLQSIIVLAKMAAHYGSKLIDLTSKSFLKLLKLGSDCLIAIFYLQQVGEKDTEQQAPYLQRESGFGFQVALIVISGLFGAVHFSERRGIFSALSRSQLAYQLR
jgi:hypothetical protein